MDNCIFCKIVSGEAPSIKVFEDENILAFVPIEKVSHGHTLVIPKKHSENIFDIDENILKKLIGVVKDLSKKVVRENNASGVNLLNASGKDAQQSIFHFHFHIVPRYRDDGLDMWIKQSL